MSKDKGAYSGSTGNAQAENLLANSYQRLFAGNGSGDDARLVLNDLVTRTGFFRPPSYSEWIAKTKTPHGFELHCALHAARQEPVRAILDYLDLSFDQMVALERAAKLEADARGT